MAQDDINELLNRSKDIIEYYNKYGAPYWKQPDMEELNKIPVKRVLSLSDYAAAFVDLKNAIGYLERLNERPPMIKIFNQYAEDIKNIIAKNTSVDTILKNLKEDLNYLKMEVEEAEGGDLFYYETSCNLRESVEKKICVLRWCYPKKESHLGNLQNRLRNIDLSLINIKNTILKEQKGLEKPFPPRFCYSPECYWWYIT